MLISRSNSQGLDSDEMPQLEVSLHGTNVDSLSTTGSVNSDIQSSKLLALPTEILESIISHLPSSRRPLRRPSRELLALSQTCYELWQIARVSILQSLWIGSSRNLARALDLVQGMLKPEREVIHHLTISCPDSGLANKESLPMLWELLPRLQHMTMVNPGIPIPWAFRGLQSATALTSLSLGFVTNDGIAVLVSMIPDLPRLRQLKIMSIVAGFGVSRSRGRTPESGELSTPIRAIVEDPVDPTPIPVLFVRDELDWHNLFVRKKLRPSSLFISDSVEPDLLFLLKSSLRCLALTPFRHPGDSETVALDPSLRYLNLTSLMYLDLDVAAIVSDGCIGDFPLFRTIKTLVLSIRQPHYTPIGLDAQALKAKFQRLPCLGCVMVSGVVGGLGERFFGELRNALVGLPLRVESTWRCDLDLLRQVEEGCGKVLLFK